MTHSLMLGLVAFAYVAILVMVLRLFRYMPKDGE